MKTTYDVVTEGRLLPGAERSQVLSHIQEAFKIDLRTAEKLILGKPRVIKRNLNETEAHKYIDRLTSIGLACRIEILHDETARKPELELKNPRTVTRCPKCNFQLDNENRSECPSCGIVIAKYLDTASNKDVTDTSADSSKMEKGPPIVKVKTHSASWLLRASAGITSIVVCSAVVNLFWFFCALFLRIKFKEQLSTPTAGGIWYVSTQNLTTIEACEWSVFLLALILVPFYFVLCPARRGGTWAQRFSDIKIVSKDPDRYPGGATWCLRLAGNITTLVCIGLAMVSVFWLILLVLPPLLNNMTFLQQKTGILSFAILAIQILFALFYYYLLFLFLRWLSRKNTPSLADKFSGTHQVRQQTESLTALLSLWIVIIITVAFSYGIRTASRSMLRPPDKASIVKQHVETGIKKNMQSLEAFRAFEDHFHAETGRYTDDMGLLLETYSNDRTSRDRAAIYAWSDGRLSIELTESGYIITLKEKVNSGPFHIMTEEGYQGKCDEIGMPLEK
jgi:hypothetical protein